MWITTTIRLTSKHYYIQKVQHITLLFDQLSNGQNGQNVWPICGYIKLLAVNLPRNVTLCTLKGSLF